jgi:SAM-dependent methyltransferase
MRYRDAVQSKLALNYIGEMTFSEYYRAVERDNSIVADVLNLAFCKTAAMEDYTAMLNSLSWEFEDNGTGGRGDAYNRAQTNPANRRQGTQTLLKCFSPSQNCMPGPDTVILDVLAGDGTVARFARTLGIPVPTIICADLSNLMVSACMRQGLPCIRQSASHSLLRDNAVDGVLIAYGSHHLDADARVSAVNEAFRVLKPGGRLVLHDFETGQPAAEWFDRVVHPYSRTGHAYPHFSREEMQHLFSGAGFQDISVFDMPDPFTLTGATAAEARSSAVKHMYEMYDLVHIAGGEGDPLAETEKWINEVLGGIEIAQDSGGYIATVQRQALVAAGAKPR